MRQAAGPMRHYPPGPDDAPPDSPEYRQYLRTYQIREQNPAAFWRPVRQAD